MRSAHLARDGRYDRIINNEILRKINASRRCPFHLAIRSMSLVGQKRRFRHICDGSASPLRTDIAYLVPISVKTSRTSRSISARSCLLNAAAAPRGPPVYAFTQEPSPFLRAARSTHQRQMARFSLFQKKSPTPARDRAPNGKPMRKTRRRAAVRSPSASRVRAR
jgi:hypothetical protein